MTALPPSRPLLPVLRRMALGLLIGTAGTLVAWQGVQVQPNPGMRITSTPVTVPLDGPQPFDLADFANLKIEGDRVDITVGALGRRRPELLTGTVTHRARNAVTFTPERQGKTVNATLDLHVQSIDRSGVVVSGPEPVQHRMNLALTRAIPLSLSLRTSSGDLKLNLLPLRLRALNVRTTSGGQDLTLPGRTGGPFSLVSGSGDITVTASPGANPEALRVNTAAGDLALNLAGLVTPALSVGTGSGDVRLTLPASSQRASLTTSSGNLNVTALPGTRGNLDVRTQSGDVTLRVPPDLNVRVRFTDRDTLTLPAGTPPATAPDLDVFIDAASGDVTVKTLDGQAIEVPDAQPAPQEAPSRAATSSPSPARPAATSAPSRANTVPSAPASSDSRP